MRRRQSIVELVIGAGFALLASLGVGQQPCRVTAEISPRNPRVGERVIYIVRVECTTMEETPQVQLPELPPDSGLNDFSPAGSFQQIQITNGRQTRSLEFRYTTAAKRAGQFRIPPTTVAVDGQIYETNEVTLNVGQTPEASTDDVPPDLRGFVVPPRIPNAPQLEKALTGKVFILALAETTQPLSGQQFLLSYHLFLDQEGLARAGIAPQRLAASEPQLPQLKEFLKEELFPLQPKLRFEEQIVGGRRYAVAPLYQVALTPTRFGHFIIEPMQMTVSIPLRRQRTGNPFDDSIFDDFFAIDPFDSNRLSVAVQSIPIELEVKPLPTQGKPANFCGAVGKFTLTAAVDKDHLVANEDVARLRVVLSGEGNASVAVPPPFPENDALKLLEDPKSNFERKIENNKLLSSKTFDYLFRPTRAGKFVIPPIETSVYNPETQRFEVLHTKEIPLVVAPGSNAPVLVAPITSQPATASTEARSGSPEVRKDLRYIHRQLKVKTGEDVRRHRAVQNALIVGATLVLATSAVAARRRRLNNASNARNRQSKCYNRVREGLRHLASAHDNEFVEACEKLALALRDYFASVLGVSSGALTTEELCQLLEARGAPEHLIGELRHLLEACDSVRYNPGGTAGASLRVSSTRAKELIEEIAKCVG
ncbi:MAG: BatD family protein [Candidatus Sumerlaeaceae bacterium]